LSPAFAPPPELVPHPAKKLAMAKSTTVEIRLKLKDLMF